MRTTGLVEEDDVLRFTDAELELTFARATGRWLGMREAGGAVLLQGGERQSAVVFTIGGVTTATGARGPTVSVVDTQTLGTAWRLESHRCHDGPRGPVLTLTCREGDWVVEHELTLVKGKARVERRITLEYRGEGEVLLRDMEIRCPPARLGEDVDCTVEAPGYATRPHQRLVGVTYGEPWKRLESPLGHAAPGWLSGIVALENARLARTLVYWAFNKSESCVPRLVRVDEGTRVSHRVDLAGRCTRGVRLTWEVQALELTRGGWHEALRRRQAWYDEIGHRVPADRPMWIERAHIYNCYVGHLTYSPGLYPTHEELTKDLGRIQALGFDTVYTMPHVPFPGYDTEDYLSADNQTGSGEGLRRLVEAAHARGMRVMIDIGIHGVVDREMADIRDAMIGEHRFDNHPLPRVNPYRTEHPEWFMLTEQGKPAATYTWAFDHANPGWQAFLAEVLAYYVREYGVDGYRVDAPTWIPFPNWARGLPYRASASIYGQAIAFEKARTALHEANPEAVVYSEAPGALYCAGFDCLYNYDYQWLFSSLLMPKGEKGYLYLAAFPDERIDAVDLAVWLEQVRLSKPAGSVTVQHLDSGDTFGWSNLQYRREVFGVPAAKAFFALCVAVGGPLMMYQRAEEGMEEWYRAILGLKRALPALDTGEADYLAVRPDDNRVFAPLRTSGSQTVIPVIHLADREVTVTLTLPPRSGAGAGWQVVDRMDGSLVAGPRGAVWSAEETGTIRMALGPFQVRVLEIVRLPV